MVRIARCCTSVLDFSIKKIWTMFKSLQNYWNRVTDITKFEKDEKILQVILALSFCPNMVKYRFKNIFQRNRSPGLLLWSGLQTKEGQRRISSDAKIVKSLRHRKYDQVIIKRTIVLWFAFLPFYSLVQTIALWLTMQWGRYMTGLVQTSSEETSSWSQSPLWLLVSYSLSHWTWASFQMGGVKPTLVDVFIYFWYSIFIT